MMGITEVENQYGGDKWRLGGLGVWLSRLLFWFVVVDVTVRKGKGSILRAHSME